MPKNVIMPALGVNQETGRLVKWIKSQGDQVRQGEMLLEIETDKATLELEAPASGVLRDVTAKEGDEIPVGTVIAMIWADGEVADSAQPKNQVTSQASQKSSPTPITSNPSATAPPPPANGGAALSRGRVAASPKARRLAAERGVDLSALSTGGNVVAADIPQENAQRSSSAEISRVWRIMAERTTEAWKTIPQFYLTRDVDASRLVELRLSLKDASSDKVTFTDLLVKKVAVSLQSHPQVNSEWRNGAIQSHNQINIGLAVAVDDGLVVPVIHNANTQTLQQIASERTRLVQRAQSAKLLPDDISGGTFTISNLGMFGIDAFQAIVNPPNAAILAIGRIAERVVAISGQPAVRPMLTLSLSCDHRVVDGARAARFLEGLALSIEQGGLDA